MTASEARPVTDPLPISLRAFTCPVTGTKKPNSQKAAIAGASYWTLVFDCETTSDDAQRLRFGTYQVRRDGALIEAGIFFDPPSVSAEERQTLHQYAEGKDCLLITRAEFVDRIFYGIGYKLRATIVGFNLPFDLSRIAIDEAPARGSMRGGFSFGLSDDKRWPRLQVKHLSSKAAFIRFAAPRRQNSNRSMQKKGDKEPAQRGFFVDVKTLAFALYARPFSLAKLCEFLGFENGKLDFHEFDGPITAEMIEYAVHDTQVTWECYSDLSTRYAKLGLHETPQERIFSEASIGKACLKEMHIAPWLECQPDFAPETIGAIMSSYLGGRAEIGIRREMRQVMLCDFLSMYPTVCTLMGLWSTVIAKGIETRDATDEAKALLETISPEALQSKSTWQELATLVRVKPDADIFPVRAKYNHAEQATIGLNYLTHDRPFWFTLADCIASKILTGKSPEIVEAIAFSPKGRQEGLRPISINGNDAYTIDPATDDFFKRLIELRHETKSQITPDDNAENTLLKTLQYTLKIWANATSYGIYVELNVEDVKSKTEVMVHHSGNDPYRKQASKIEKPGTYFHPLLATLITGAARLMLAITERLAADSGLEWSFCDTDSMALAKPEQMNHGDFAGKVQNIIDWFSGLNPYDFEGSILKSESVNYSLDNAKELEPLYCWAVSAKRYALFNLADDGRPVLRKASAHGLGHLRAPYDEENPATGFPKPRDKLANIGVELWQHDLWVRVIEAALAGKPDQVPLDYHPNLRLPAISRYAATSPHLLKWFEDHNRNKSYAAQVKPFGFLTTLSMRRVNEGQTILDNPHKRRPNPSAIRPVSPYADDPAIAAKSAFDRNGSGKVLREQLQTYRECLAQYHLQPENKFLNGLWLDRGPTSRRHVKGCAVLNIGKEANEWEKQAVLGFDSEAQPNHGLSPQDIGTLQSDLEELRNVFSLSAMAEFAHLTTAQIERFISSDSHSKFAIEKAPSMLAVTQHFRERAVRERDKLDVLRRRVEEIGPRAAAREVGCDASNLLRKLGNVRMKDVSVR